jgi:hypothetical protein
VAQAPPGEFVSEAVEVDAESGRETFDDGDQTGTV